MPHLFEQVDLEGRFETYRCHPCAPLEGRTKPYRAQGLKTGNHYVVKARSSWKDGFDREVAAFDQLAGKQGIDHIVLPQEIFSFRDDRYLALRYIHGIDFADYLMRRHHLSIEELVVVLDPVCETLDTLHRYGILHGDVKPSNILLEFSEKTENSKNSQDNNNHALPTLVLETYLCDFNVATPLHKGNLSPREGTPIYMAPEIWQCWKKDARTDIYALGVLVFESLTGFYPFLGKNDKETGDRHILQEIPSAFLRNSTLPVDIDLFFKKALAKDPDGRYQSAGALREALVQVACFGGI